MIHLKKLGVKATGTVRQNRIYEMVLKLNKNKKLVPTREAVKVFLNKNSERGSFEVKHDEISGINYVAVKDSKVVLILSNACGVLPFEEMERGKTLIDFPKSFSVYNDCMGGVGLHDQHVSDLKINMKTKKWTWAILRRILEASLSNAYVIWSHCVSVKEREHVGVKDFAIEIAEQYLLPNEEKLKTHTYINTNVRRQCQECKYRVVNYCMNCKMHLCIKCFNKIHKIIVHNSTRSEKRIHCADDECQKRTFSFCNECDLNFCPSCFEKYHKNKKIKYI